MGTETGPYGALRFEFGQISRGRNEKWQTHLFFKILKN